MDNSITQLIYIYRLLKVHRVSWGCTILRLRIVQDPAVAFPVLLGVEMRVSRV